jgi:hypothetical protein
MGGSMQEGAEQAARTGAPAPGRAPAGSWTVFWLALATFLAVRLVSLAAMLLDRTDLEALLGASYTGPVDFLAWHGDGSHYQSIASEGYGRPSGDPLRESCDGLDPRAAATFCPPYLGGVRLTNLAFFPLFPLLVRSAGAIGADTRWAAVVIAVVASLAAAGLLGMLGARVHSARVGVLAAGIWAAHPGALVLWMGRPESSFAALTAAGLLLLLHGRLVAGGALAGLAGLLRFQSVALTFATWVAALRHRRSTRARTTVAAVLLSVSGTAVYLAFVAVRTGDPRGWWAVQESWNSNADWGAGKAQFVATSLVSAPPMQAASAWALVVSVLLLGCLAALRMPAELVAFCGVLLAGLLVQGQYHEHVLRFLVVIQPLLIPVAVLLSRLPLLLAGTLVCAGALASGSLTAHALLAGQWLL